MRVTEVINFRVDRNTLTILNELAEQYGVTKSEIIRQALLFFLNNQDKEIREKITAKAQIADIKKEGQEELYKVMYADRYMNSFLKVCKQCKISFNDAVVTIAVSYMKEAKILGKEKEFKYVTLTIINEVKKMGKDSLAEKLEALLNGED